MIKGWVCTVHVAEYLGECQGLRSSRVGLNFSFGRTCITEKCTYPSTHQWTFTKIGLHSLETLLVPPPHGTPLSTGTLICYGWICFPQEIGHTPMQCKQYCACGSRKVFNSLSKKKKKHNLNFSWKCRKSEWEWKLLNCVQFFVIVVHRILQARILEWVACPVARGSSQPRDRTQVSGIAGGFFELSRKESPRILEWAVYPFTSRSFSPRNQTGVSCIADGFFTNSALSKVQKCRKDCHYMMLLSSSWLAGLLQESWGPRGRWHWQSRAPGRPALCLCQDVPWQVLLPTPHPRSICHPPSCPAPLLLTLLPMGWTLCTCY